MNQVSHSPSGASEHVRWSKRIGFQRYLRLLSRLSRMTPAEATARGIRIPLKKLAASRGHAATGAGPFGQRPALAPVGVSVRDWLIQRFDQRFLYGPAFKQTLQAPEVRDALASRHVVDMAMAMASNGLDLLGHRVRVAPGGMDWHVDPRSKQDAWSHDVMDEASAISSEDADVKYVWEVNRQQYLTLLGRAFWHTDDPRFAHDAVSLIDDWIAANPRGRGVNWCSHLEVAMRAISWLWTMPYVLALPDLDDRFLARWLESLADHHRHLASNLSIYTDPTNHLLGEATGLWMLSTVFPEFPGASTERARAMDVLAREIGRQIGPDGVNRERATSYHRFVLDFLLQIIALGRRVGETLPPVLHERARAALAFVSALIGRQGDVPMIGDSDDARGLPLPEMNGWDFRDLLSTGAVLFDRPDWKAQAGALAESTVWLLGREGAETFRLMSHPGRPTASAIFRDGGYCIFKGNSPSLRADTIFDVGPLGLLPNAAHGHADALSLMIRVNDELLLADPGTGTYFADREVRDWFGSTAAHNTLTIDDLDQADRFDVFKWVNPMPVALMASFNGRHVDYAAARHDGYSRLRKAVTHSRHVLFVRPGSWIIVDYVDGADEHLITSRYHFAPGTRLEPEPSGSFVATSPATGSGLRFTFAELGELGTLASCDEPAFWSARYGSWQSSPQLRMETRRPTPTALCTFISAFVADRGASRATERIMECRTQPMARGAKLWTTVSPQGDEQSVLVNPRSNRVTLPDGLSSHAAFRYARQSPTGARDVTFTCDEPTRQSIGVRAVCQERSSSLSALHGSH